MLILKTSHIPRHLSLAFKVGVNINENLSYYTQTVTLKEIDVIIDYSHFIACDQNQI